LPSSLNIKQFIICNTATANDPGEHWFVVFKPRRFCLEIFDSLGVNSMKENKLLTILSQFNAKTITFNESQFQSDSSISCGKFCIFFVIQRFHNLDLSYDDFLTEMFDSDCTINERKVISFCNQILQDFEIESE
jgi:hypothetical protein